jgi:hypothetical protein
MMYQMLLKRREDALRAQAQSENPALVELRDKLLEQLQQLSLPANALDDMIDRFGGHENVAEMTGRAGRVVRMSPSSKSPSKSPAKLQTSSTVTPTPPSPAASARFAYVHRGGKPLSSIKGLSSNKGEVELDQLNIVERQRFQDGKKKIAIISDAASTGISLHANVASGSSERRRSHYTIELPWAADKAIQQLGRSHRAGQLSAPRYSLVVTNLGGERR